MPKNQSKDKLLALRHSCEHILTQAIREFYPKLLMAMGPATEEGFYLDFDLPAEKISEADFPKIEKAMKKIINQNLPFKRKVLSVTQARKLFKDNPYKQEWLDEIEKRGEKATVFWTGKEFVDLCAGPHAKSTGEIGAFKLLSMAGAYWRGDEKNKMLTRIYGTAFPTQKELDEFVARLEEAKKRDHRKLGQEMDLFSQNDELGAGLILWHPKLSIVREEIELWWRKEHRKRGYQYVYTPHIGRKILWDRSGHTNFYKELMYPPLTDERKDVYFLKPMNCNAHMLIYKSRPRSYKELPIRWCELGTVYRYELEGVRHGILRPRGFTQDDAHIICTKEQLIPEIGAVLDFALEMNAVFGFKNLHYDLSLMNPQNQVKYAGDSKEWNTAQEILRKILRKRKVKFGEDVGGAKFYGPSIDLKAEDALGRLWQGTTIQFDFNLPSRFKLSYIGQDGKEHTPYMIHRTLLGSMERFIGVLIEQYAGAFPVWLAPIQTQILPITEEQSSYAQQISQKLQQEGIRAQADMSNQTLSYRIRQGQLEKTPFMLIVGKKEQQENTITVRQRDGQDLKFKPLTWFIKEIKNLIETRSLNLIKL